MPIHAWTRVSAGLFHHFQLHWIAAISDALNSGQLPTGYFALAEQVISGPIPDVLTLRLSAPGKARPDAPPSVAVATAPPKTRIVCRSDVERYARKANRITVRHESGDVVAVIEIVSPGNKDSRNALRAFVDKALGLLNQGVNLLIVDLFPPTPRDPQGIHKAIWDEIHEEPLKIPRDKPLTVAAYTGAPERRAYVEPVAVGDMLPEMPLFLTPEFYVPLELEPTYQAAWARFPAPLKGALESPPGRPRRKR